MRNSFNMKDKLNKIRKELDIRLTNIPKRYSYVVDFDYYNENLYVELDFYTGSEFNIESWEQEEVLKLEYEKNENTTKLIEDIVTKINNHIKKYYLDEINRKKYKDIIVDIMETYCEKVLKEEMVNEYDELCDWDYEIYDLENGIQCGADVFDNGICLNIYYHKIYDVNEEKYYNYKTEDELIELIKQLTDKFLINEKIKMEEIIKEREKEYKEQYYDENYESPEDYPDWDGDESIMYYIDNYDGSEDEDDDELED